MSAKRDIFSAQPLAGVVRDEISALVSRIKRADAQAYAPQAAMVPQRMTESPRAQAASAQDSQWADDWQLPKEVLDYFIIERA